MNCPKPFDVNSRSNTSLISFVKIESLSAQRKRIGRWICFASSAIKNDGCATIAAVIRDDNSLCFIKSTTTFAP